MRGNLGQCLYNFGNKGVHIEDKNCSCSYCNLFHPAPQLKKSEDGKINTMNISGRVIVDIHYANYKTFTTNDFFNLDLILIQCNYTDYQDFLSSIANSELLVQPFFNSKFSYYTIFMYDGIESLHNLPTLLSQTNYHSNKITLANIESRHAPLIKNQFWKINFTTPVNIRQGNYIMKELDIDACFQTLIRRLYQLVYFYIQDSGELMVYREPVLNSKSETILKYNTFHQNSNKKNKDYQLKGCSGSIYCKVPENEKIYWLLAMYTHIGIHTGHGLGKIDIEGLYTPILSKVYRLDTIQVNIDELNLNLNNVEMQEDIMRYAYFPQSYQELEIHKNENESRKIQLMQPIDKVYQKTMVMYFEDKLDANFLPQSYGFRKGKSSAKAIRQAIHIIKNETQYTHVVQCDIDAFFDSIPIDELLKRWHEYHKDIAITYYTRLWIINGMIQQGLWSENEQGLPQGSPISPLLSNFYFHPIDLYIEKEISPKFIRYADDILLFFESEERAKYGLIQLIKRLDKSKLKLNEEYKILPIRESIHYLGIALVNGEPHLSHEKTNRIIQKLKRTKLFWGKTLHRKFEESIEGIESYYKQLIHKDELILLDNALQDMYLESTTAWKQDWRGLKVKEIKELLAQLPYISEYYSKNKLKYHRELYLKLSSTAHKVSQIEFHTKQKRDYRLEQKNSRELIIKDRGVLLGLSKDKITVKQKDKATLYIRLVDISNITILSSGVSISSHLIDAATSSGIDIQFLKPDGNIQAAITASYTPDSTIALRQIITSNDPEEIHKISQWIVINKIENQRKLIKYLSKYHKKNKSTSSLHFESYLAKSIELIGQIKSLPILQDESPKNNRIMLIEARAATLYWDIFRIYLGQYAIEFPERQTRYAEHSINQMLNYGYGILYTRVQKQIAYSKLMPQLSYLHAIQDAKPSLSWDLIEQYRSWLVDRVVLTYLIQGRYQQQHEGKLDDKTREQLTEKLLQVYQSYNLYDGINDRLEHIMRLQLQNFKKYILGESKKIKFFSPKW